jgi:hypothetical protein
LVATLGFDQLLIAEAATDFRHEPASGCILATCEEQPFVCLNRIACEAEPAAVVEPTKFKLAVGIAQVGAGAEPLQRERGIGPGADAFLVEDSKVMPSVEIALARLFAGEPKREGVVAALVSRDGPGGIARRVG